MNGDCVQLVSHVNTALAVYSCRFVRIGLKLVQI